jgi:hypothetical protein
MSRYRSYAVTLTTLGVHDFDADQVPPALTRYRTTMMDQALKVVDQNHQLPVAQQFVWTIPGWTRFSRSPTAAS